MTCFNILISRFDAVSNNVILNAPDAIKKISVLWQESQGNIML